MAAERLLGYTAQEAIGRPITMLIPAERLSEEETIIAKIRRGERIEHFDTERRRKNGSLIDLSITVSPIKDATGRVVGASKIARDISERKRSQERQELLMGEMKHRTRNLVAVIDALARQSRPRHDPAGAALLDAFVGRLRALLSTGEIIVGSTERKASLRILFETVLQPFRSPECSASILLDGCDAEVSERTAGTLALVIHELATNALKHGALKSSHGGVTLRWCRDKAGRLVIEWKETVVSPIAAPASTGFGTRVIKSALASEIDSETTMAFEPDGVRCRLAFRPE